MDQEVVDSPLNPGFQSGSIEYKIVASLERVSEAFKALLWQEAKEEALSPIQIQILIFLRFHSSEKCKVSYLAQEFNLTKATISDAVKVLEQKGLIGKLTEPADTRSYTIHLTETGRNVAQKTAVFANVLSAPLQELSLGQKEILYTSLLELIYKLNQSGIISIQRMCFNCRFYGIDQNGEPHFCNLLRMPLRPYELRVNCPEHRPAER
jgi:DNA-binding MarR family transcriptional regulator